MTGSRIRRLYELIEDNEEAVILLNQLVIERNTLLEESRYDELTKTFNRRILKDDEINYDVVIMCDLDDFKKYNDTYGHHTGDKILVLVSSLLKSITRSDDFVCRYGGDEFVIVLKKCSIEDAFAKLEIIKKQAEDMDDLGFGITLSFGVTKYEEGKSLESAIKEADKALYESKDEGKNRVTVYQRNKVLKRN